MGKKKKDKKRSYHTANDGKKRPAHPRGEGGNKQAGSEEHKSGVNGGVVPSIAIKS